MKTFSPGFNQSFGLHQLDEDLFFNFRSELWPSSTFQKKN